MNGTLITSLDPSVLPIFVDQSAYWLERYTHDKLDAEGIWHEVWVDVIKYNARGKRQAEVSCKWLADRHPKERYRVRKIDAPAPGGMAVPPFTTTANSPQQEAAS